MGGLEFWNHGCQKLELGLAVYILGEHSTRNEDIHGGCMNCGKPVEGKGLYIYI